MVRMFAILAIALGVARTSSADDVFLKVQHGTVDSGGVKIHYYKQNYPRPPYKEDMSPVVKVTVPVLIFHGLNDTALLASALNRTWEWVDKSLTIVTVPGAGHWVQSDASELVSSTMKSWLSLNLK